VSSKLGTTMSVFVRMHRATMGGRAERTWVIASRTQIGRDT
jgi:hypothetical protein